MPGVARLALTWLPPLAWMVVIFAFSSQHGGGHLPESEVLLRKLGHVTGYFVLTILLLRALHRAEVAPAMPIAIAAALAYAVSDEWHQSFVPGRTATPVDVGIDAIGIGLAALTAGRTRVHERLA
jgi:VanZ family protein